MDAVESYMDLRVDCFDVVVRGLALGIKLSRFGLVRAKRVNRSNFGTPLFREMMIAAEARNRFDLRSD